MASHSKDSRPVWLQSMRVGNIHVLYYAQWWSRCAWFTRAASGGYFMSLYICVSNAVSFLSGPSMSRFIASSPFLNWTRSWTSSLGEALSISCPAWTHAIIACCASYSESHFWPQQVSPRRWLGLDVHQSMMKFSANVSNEDAWSCVQLLLSLKPVESPLELHFPIHVFGPRATFPFPLYPALKSPISSSLSVNATEHLPLVYSVLQFSS